MYSNLFSPVQIGKKTAPNRLTAQAMEGNDGENGGKPSERTTERYRELARGGWGVAVMEASSVNEHSLARKNGLIINRGNLDAFRRTVDGFKSVNPDALFLLQITHAGSKGSPEFSMPLRICPEDAGTSGETAPKGRLLKEEEIEAIRKDFVRAVILASDAGFDGVDLKMCHGYFGAEMLRPSNRRSDRWGGSFGNRTRFFRQSIEELRPLLHSRDFILGSRISMYEGTRGGCGTAGPDEIIEDLTEMDELIKLMDGLGMDYVNVSAGIPGVTSEMTRPVNRGKWLYLHHFRYARHVKQLLAQADSGMRVIGSAYTILGEDAPAAAEENITKEYADLAGFGRQSFADPFYPEKLKNGEDIDYCTACSGCSKLMIKQLNDGCIIYNEYYKNLWKNKE